MAYQRRNNGYRGNNKGYKAVTTSSKPKPRLSRPSEYQIAIFEAVTKAAEQVINNFRSGIKTVIGIHVDALAGCGKTSTTVEKDYYLPAELRQDAVSVAFNSDIASVLKERVADGVESKTIHALGRAALVRAFPRLNSYSALDTRKYDGYLNAELGNWEPRTMVARENVIKMIDRARDYMAWTAEAMDPLFDQYDMDSGHLTRDEFLRLAQKVLVAGLQDTNRMDYGDMIAMPLYHNLELRRYSLLSVDEYQDLCPSQHELLDRSIRPGGLFVSVGDENQAIYMWRGADCDSIAHGVARYNSTRYLLPRTYRCGKAIVASAQEFVPALECPSNAHEGEVREMAIDKLVDEAQPGDAILSRLNAPLVKLCFALIRAGIPANIQGRDVSDRLKFMIKRSEAKTIDALLAWIEKWRETEVARLTRQHKPIETANDYAECLSTLCEGRFEIVEVIQAIDDLFPKNMPERIVILSSVHRAKGKEWKRVFVLEDTFFLKNGNPREEVNLAYVARTRAMNMLIKVKSR